MIIVCFIIPVIIIPYTYYLKSASIIEDKYNHYAKQILTFTKYKMKALHKTMIYESENIINNQPLHDVLLKEKADKDFYEDVQFIRAARELNEHLSTVTNLYEEIKGIGIISNYNNRYISGNGVYELVNNQQAYEDILRLATEGNGQERWYHHIRDDRVIGIYLVRLIRDRNTYRELGLLLIQMDIQSFREIYGYVHDERGENIEIVLDNKYVLYQEHEQAVIDKSNFQNANEEYYTYIKDGNYIIRDSLIKPSWSIYMSLPRGNLNREISELGKFYIYVLLLVGIVAIAMASIMSYDLVGAINKLKEKVTRIEKGESYKDIQLNRKDELGYLDHHFDEMADNMRNLVQWIYLEELTRKEVELKSLQEQINPHFIFNTLESINWMAQMKQAPEISEMVNALSQLLEVNIRNGEKLTTIKDEINYINAYIKIMKKRYGNRFNYKVEVEEELETIQIPKLILQPLIENAIYHGVESAKHIVTLTVSAFRRDDRVILCVNDDGIGIEPDKLRGIIGGLEEKIYSYTTKKDKSVGLNNVNKRMKLFYNERGAMHIQSQVEQGTRITIEIPYKGGHNIV